jgi:dTDP-4-amino-4,6-dideoxygalactose transaminase
VQAVALRVKLKFLDEWNARRSAIAARYTGELASTGLVLPSVPEWAEPIWHVYVVQHAKRDEIQESLQAAGIGTLIHYPIPPHMQDAYRDMGCGTGRFPIAESMANRVLSLPMGPQLNEASVEAVIAALKAAAKA